MKILLDECVDWRLGGELSGHEVTAVFRKGWVGIENGELLSFAGEEFDVLLTVDQNMSFQQSISKFDIAVVVLKSPSTRLVDLVSLVPELLDVLGSIQAGQINWVGT